MKLKNLIRKTAALSLALTFSLAGPGGGSKGTTAEPAPSAEVQSISLSSDSSLAAVLRWVRSLIYVGQAGGSLHP